MGTPSTRAKAKWNRNHYDQLKVVIPKGSREVIKEMAISRNMSVSEYIRYLISQDAERTGKEEVKEILTL